MARANGGGTVKRSVPYAVVETFLRELGIEEPGYVREVRLRAPRTIEVLLYARDLDGAKFIGDDGVALEGTTIHIETLSDDPELARGLREANQIADLLGPETTARALRLLVDDEDAS